MNETNARANTGLDAVQNNAHTNTKQDAVQTNILAETRDISVSRGGEKILREVSVRIHENDFVTIIGPNGAGKTMLLKCLMGFYRPDSGSVHRKKDLRIGYVPQTMQCEQSMPMTVARFLRLRRQVSKADISTVAQETGIEHALHKALFALSGGELQRALLARSLLGNPELLVLDEPAQNLDVSGQLAFYKLLSHVRQSRQVSILMVSHDLHMVMASTRQVVCLYHHVCCSGEPHIVTKDPEFISLFGEDMARMMAVYQHSHDHGHEHGHEQGFDHKTEA